MLIAWIAADLAWWRGVDRLIRPRADSGLANGARRIARLLLGGFAAFQAGYILTVLVRFMEWPMPDLFPLSWHAAAYVWHLLVLPTTAGAWAIARIARRMRKRPGVDPVKKWFQKLRPPRLAGSLASGVQDSETPTEPEAASAPRVSEPPRPASPLASGGGREVVGPAEAAMGGTSGVRVKPSRIEPSPVEPSPVEPSPVEPSPVARLTRRQALAFAAAAAAPPLAATVITARAVAALGTFRIRRVELAIPSLPPDLDGLTIVHVSDLHIGKFVPTGLAERVADAANALAADLVAFTGDLIDIGDLDRLPAALAFLRRLDRRHGLAIIEGNHDVMADAERFEGEVRFAGLPLLLDESVVCRVPGRATPVQLLGIAWGAWVTGAELGYTGRRANRRHRQYHPAAAAASIGNVLGQREPGAFPILLSHHPHAFDPAAAAGLPLTLAGHTHGGQIMLTDRLGVGPARFRYWSGAYAKGDNKLFVSNGIGAWFPIRLNAPADIAHLTLRAVPGAPGAAPMARRERRDQS